MVSTESKALPQQAKNQRKSIPVSILTGFLGSGKTTLINNILGYDHGLKVAVVVNEFGDISIDDRLINNRAENVIELANGCICCSMQGDLIRTLHQVTSGDADIDYILLETSGLSDPLPVANSILSEELGDAVRLDGIITVIDALNFDANLACAEVAFNQLFHGDLLLINKTDLVEQHVPDLIKQGVRKINRSARLLTCVNGNVDPLLLLDVNISTLQETAITAPGSAIDSFRNSHQHNDAAEFDCVSLESDKPVNADLFRTFVTRLPVDVYRGKGILNVADNDCEQVFHLVGDRCVVTQGEPWAQNATRLTQLVLIGQDLNRDDLLQELHGCLAHV